MIVNGVLYASSFTQSDTSEDFIFIDGEFRIGGASQDFPMVKLASFRSELNDTTGVIIENPTDDSQARPALFIVGKPTGVVPNASYFGISVIPPNWVNPDVGVQVPLNCAFIQSGGNLSGGMVFYNDDGPMYFANNLTDGSQPCFYISPSSLNGIGQTNPGSFGIHNNDPKAFLDIIGASATRASFRIRPATGTPTGDALQDGIFYVTTTEVIVQINGALYKLNKTAI